MSAAATQFPTVKIGPVEHQVVPQRIGRLRYQLDLAVEAVKGRNMDFPSFSDFLAAGPEVVHPFLLAFYPKLMPLWQFAGFGTQSDYERSLSAPALSEDGSPVLDPAGNPVFIPGERTYDPERDESPTTHEIVVAFREAFKAHDMDSAKGLKSFIPFDMVQGWIRVRMAMLVEKDRADLRETLSPSTLSTSAS